MNDKTCLIISGGTFSRPVCGIPDADYIIACDSGLDHALLLSLRPDLVMGDLDSVSKEGAKLIEEKEIPCERFPRMKDHTDTAIAIMRALELGYRNIHLLCAFGGRTDHFIGNVQAARLAASKGALVRLSDADTDMFVFSGRSLAVAKREGFSLSVFSLSDECSGVSIRGALYELSDSVLRNDDPIGVSNEFVDDEAVISVKSGVLTVVMSRL